MDSHFGDLNGKEFQCSGRGWGGGEAEAGRGITPHPARTRLTVSLAHFLRKPPVIVADLRRNGGPEQPGVALTWLLPSACELNPPVCAAGPRSAEIPEASETQEASRRAWISSSLSPADSSSEDSLQSGQRGTDSNRISVFLS